MILQVHEGGYRYPSAAEPAVAEVGLSVAAGELVLLTGPTGCGKSTLLRLCAGLLGRHGQGEVLGEVLVGGEDPASMPPARRVTTLGFVSQVPSDQLVTGTLADEVAFGLESAGWEPERMEARIAELLPLLGLPEEPDRSVRAPSGGQQQRLVVAAALAGRAPLLLLDEPLAQLDPVGAQRLLVGLRTLADRGVAVVVVEHRLEACWPVLDRVLVMEDGRLVAEAPPDGLDVSVLRRLGLTVPALLDLEDRVGALDGLELRSQSGGPTSEGSEIRSGAKVLSTGPLSWTWPGAEAPALRDAQLLLRAGDRVAVVGANGSGKSTLLAALSGHVGGGEVRCIGRVVDVPQDPDLALFCDTVAQELAHGPREAGLDRDAVTARAARSAEALSLGELLDRAPQALSRGQRLRVAVGGALACQPDVLLLDEPTSGQDHEQVERMMRALRLALVDRALVFATHDLDLALRHATHVLVLDGGRIVDQGDPTTVLARLSEELPLRLPPLARICLDHGWPVVTAEALAELLR